MWSIFCDLASVISSPSVPLMCEISAVLPCEAPCFRPLACVRSKQGAWNESWLMLEHNDWMSSSSFFLQNDKCKFSLQSTSFLGSNFTRGFHKSAAVPPQHCSYYSDNKRASNMSYKIGYVFLISSMALALKDFILAQQRKAQKHQYGWAG